MSQQNHPTDALAANAGVIRFPEVSVRTLKQVPSLPAKQQKHFYTTPDATINSSVDEGLFAHLQGAEDSSEFAYAEANRLGTQAAYLNTPHMVQRTLVPLMLPGAKEAAYGNEPFALPFPHLQKGDLAFYLRLENDWGLVDMRNFAVQEGRSSKLPLSLVCRDWEEAVRKRKRGRLSGTEMSKSLMMSEGSQIFVNLQTINYILHGIQHYGDTEPGWRDTFWRGFGLHRLDAAVKSNAEMLCTHVVRHCMTPFGVVASETNQQSDQAVAMVVDGRAERMRNYWVEANNEEGGLHMPQPGDELILGLERVEMRLDEDIMNDSDAFEHEFEKWTYVLPNRASVVPSVRMAFPLKRSVMCVLPAERKHYIWQLVPSVASAANQLCWDRAGFWRLGILY